MNVEAQSVHLMAIIAVHESVCVGAAGVVGGAVPSVGAAALVVRVDRAGCRAAACYGDTSANTRLATVAPNCPNGVVSGYSHVIQITCQCGAVYKRAPVPVNLVVVENGIVVLDGGFDGETVIIIGVPCCTVTVNGTFVSCDRGAETW